jgi:GT2 family glycosyltransferase
MISLITCVRNRFTCLENMVRSLESAKGHENAELIVVDYCSGDGDVQALLDQAKVAGVRLRREEAYNRAAAFSVGYARSRGEVVLFCDVDIVLPEDVLEIAARSVRSGNVCRFVGPMRHGHFTGQLRMTAQHLSSARSVVLYGFVPADYLETGGWDEKKVAHDDQDEDMLERIRKAGLNMAHASPRGLRREALPRTHPLHPSLAIAAAYAGDHAPARAPSSVVIAIRSKHDHLHGLCACLLSVPFQKKRCVLTDTAVYFRSLLELEADWVVSLHEDVFVWDPARLTRLIGHIVREGYAWCECGPGGTGRRPAGSTPMSSQFFCVLNTRAVEAALHSRGGSVASDPGLRERSAASVGWAASEAGQVLYLEAAPWCQDRQGSIVSDHEGVPLLIHAGGGRHWSDPEERVRIGRAVDYCLSMKARTDTDRMAHEEDGLSACSSLPRPECSAEHGRADGQAEQTEIRTLGIPVLNRGDLLLRCVESVDNPIHTLLIVNNGEDQSVAKATARIRHRDFASQDFFNTIRVEKFRNLGCSRSWNHIIRTSHGAWLISGSDVQFAPGDIERIMAALDANRDASIILAMGYSVFCFTEIGLRQVGLFDENFFPAYFEDNDHFRRVHLAGAKAARVPGFKAVHGEPPHWGSSTIKSDPDLERRNALTFPNLWQYYVKKWGGGPGHETYARPYNLYDVPLDHWELDMALRRTNSATWGERR